MTAAYETSNPRIVIVGAGMVGASIAFHLSRRGADVTVVDAGDPGTAASRVSFAWANAHGKQPRHYHDLNRRSADMWYRLARRLDDSSIITWGGEMRWAVTQEGADALSQNVREMQSWGYPIRQLNPEQVREMEPDLVTTDIVTASYTDSEFHVDTGAFIRACLDRAQTAGVTLKTNTRVQSLGISRSGGEARVESVVTDSEEIAGDVVVLAGGADTQELASFAGLEIPFGHTFGATVLTHPTGPIFSNVAVVHTPRDRNPMMNVRQFHDGTVMVHGGSHGGDQDESMGRTDEDAQVVLDSIGDYIPALGDAEIAEIRRGRRPMPADGHPVLGFTESVPNLYVAAMHSGVSLAAIVGEFTTTEILDGARIDILEPFRAERFT